MRGTGSFLYAGVFAYVAGTPFAYITIYHVPVQFYGLLFGLGIIGIMVANLVNLRLVPRFGYDRMLLFGTVITATSAIVTAVTAHTGWGGLWGLVTPLFVFVSMTGFVVANSVTGAMADFPERAGAVSALVGALQYGLGMVGSGLVGTFADGTPWPMGWVVAISGIGSLLCMGLLAPERIRKISDAGYEKIA